jgi:hypothetical protein
MRRFGAWVTGALAVALWILPIWWAWSWTGDRAALDARWQRIGHLERRVAELQALPVSPAFQPLEAVLPAVLAALPVRAELVPDARESPAQPATTSATVGTGRPHTTVDLLRHAVPVPEVRAIRRLRMSTALPQLSGARLTEAIGRLDALQYAWPVEIPALLWQADSKTLSVVLVVYGGFPPV